LRSGGPSNCRRRPGWSCYRTWGALRSSRARDRGGQSRGPGRASGCACLTLRSCWSILARWPCVTLISLGSSGSCYCALRPDGSCWPCDCGLLTARPRRPGISLLALIAGRALGPCGPCGIGLRSCRTCRTCDYRRRSSRARWTCDRRWQTLGSGGSSVSA
jgi:hypothetical protein